MIMLLEGWQTKNYFPYTVELKLRNGEVYGNVSFEIPTPEVRYTKENGVIAIDTNTSSIHLAIAEVSKTGELLSYQTISLHNLLGLSQNSKDQQEWILAHQIVNLAIEKGKAIALENLKKLRKGKSGDGKAKLRKILHNWNAKKFLQKLKKGSNVKRSGGSGGKSRLHLSYWHAKVCTTVEHRQRHSICICNREKGTGL
jgi:Hypothetical protein TTE0071